MVQPARETLYDYKDRLSWVKDLGWNAKKLRQVPVHLEQTDSQPFISLTEITPGKYARLYVYKNEVSPEIWNSLSNFIANLGGPSGWEQQGLEGTNVWDSRKGKETEEKWGRKPLE